MAFENSKIASIELEKEMFIRTNTIRIIDEVILESKNISKFINEIYLSCFSYTFYFNNKERFKNIIAETDEELFNKLDMYLLYESYFLGYDNKDFYVLNNLDIKNKFRNIMILKRDINLAIINLLKEKENEDILEDLDIKNRLKNLSFEISKMNYIFNTFKHYSFLRMKKDEISMKEISILLDDYKKTSNRIDIEIKTFKNQ